METVTRTIGDLSQPDRSALERVVGHPLQERQQIVIQVFDATIQPLNGNDPSRALPAWCNVYEGMSEAEIEAADKSIVRSQTTRPFEP